MNTKLIRLPSGDYLRADSIIQIRTAPSGKYGETNDCVALDTLHPGCSDSIRIVRSTHIDATALADSIAAQCGYSAEPAQQPDAAQIDYQRIAFDARDILRCGHVANVPAELAKLASRYGDALGRIATLQREQADARQPVSAAELLPVLGDAVTRLKLLEGTAHPSVADSAWAIRGLVQRAIIQLEEEQS